MAEALRSFQIQPFEVEDFSGGLTENFFDSGPTRYATADNFLITVDRKLQVRPGSIPFDPVNYLLPGQPRRVDGLFTYINESRLLVNQGRTILSLPEVTNPVWTPIVGPSGNEALSAGTTYSVVTEGEFQRQIYFASDAFALPVRIYHDQNNNYVARTAGLPRVQNPSTYNDSSLLTKCIVNANALKASMISHYTDFDNSGFQIVPSATNLHYLTDKWSLCYLQGVVFVGGDPEFPGPVPLPTPAPNAFDLTSLLNLVYAMNLSFSHHNSLGLGIFYYHFQGYFPGFDGYLPKVQFSPLALLSNPTQPLDLYTASQMLDDLYQKWFWHQLAVNLHGQGVVNSIALMSRYIVAQSKIGVVSYDPVNKLYLKMPPTVAPNYQDFFNYVNGLKEIHNAHVEGGGGSNLAPYGTLGGPFNTIANTQVDTISKVTLPEVGTIDQAYLMISWLRVLYSQEHLADSQSTIATVTPPDFVSQAATNITFNATAASPNITNVTDVVAAALTTLDVGSYVWVNDGFPFTPFFTGAAGTQFVARVTASGVGTATLSKNSINNAVVALAQSASMMFHSNYSSGIPVTGSPATLAGENLTNPLTTLGSDLTTWNALAQEYMYALFNHMSNANKHRGLANQPNVNYFSPTNTSTIPQWWVPTIASVAYGFTYFYQYTVEPNGIIYQNESNPVYSGAVETVEPFYLGYVVNAPVAGQSFWTSTQVYQTNPIVISQIPVIVNDALTNYDTANIQVKIYRTTDGGTTFYLDATIPNGTTTYNDTANGTVTPPGQTILSTRQTLYTTGGIVGNDQPPQAKYMTIFNGVAYYANLFDTGQYFPNRLRQSIPNDPDAAPATFFDDFEDEITGLSYTRSNLIVFCKNSIYRESGGFTPNGQGQFAHERISDSIGCIGAHSIVRTEIGVFFGGTDGFYYTDGFQLIKISIDLDQTYRALVQNDAQKTRIYGAYDKTTRRIWWSVQSTPTDTECDKCFIFYLNYGVKPSGVFTTASNDGSLVPTAANPGNAQYWRNGAVIFFQGQLTRGDERGVLLKSDPNAKTDPKIDLSINASLWNTVAIPWNYTSTVMDYGTHYKRKWATKVNVTGKNVGNAAAQITSISDTGRVILPLAPVNYLGNCIWGDPSLIWGSTNFTWKYDGNLDAWRRFPAGSLRANMRELEITPARIGIYRFEDYPNGCTVTANSGAKTVTISTPAGYSSIVWPIDVVDYYVALQSDGYVAEYLITAVAGAVLTVSDPNSTLPNSAGLGWVIRGYKKNARFELSAYVVHFALLGDKTSSYRSAADSGENT